MTGTAALRTQVFLRTLTHTTTRLLLLSTCRNVLLQVLVQT